MAKTLKEIGHNITLRGFVIHQVIKTAGERDTALKEAKSLIKTSKKEKQFVGRINKAYGQKSPIYGIFGDIDPTFKNLLENYLLEDDFLSFSRKAIAHYERVLSTSAPATGGFIIFAHYLNSENNSEYLLVLTINNKDGYMVSEADLTIQDIKNIDLSKVDVACQINITKWQKIESELDKESKTYLSFAKGIKDVSYYFMSFIDCADKTTNTESTKRLIIAFNSYCKEKGYNHKDTLKKRNEVFEYCDGCMKNNKEILLSTISAILNPDSPAEFEEFACNEEYGVNPIISGDKPQLKKLRYIYYKDNDITVGFDNNLLGKDVFYDKSKKQLTFKNLPTNLIKELER